MMHFVDKVLEETVKYELDCKRSLAKFYFYFFTTHPLIIRTPLFKIPRSAHANLIIHTNILWEVMVNT